MLTVHKFILPLGNRVEMEMPMDSVIQCVQMQRGDACIWALVDTDKPLCTHHFEIYGTGNPMSGHALQYVGTLQLNEGRLALHVYERTDV